MGFEDSRVLQPSACPCPAHPPTHLPTQPCSAGWGADPNRIDEVPESFWATVAPDVHAEITEYLFDQDFDQAAYTHKMLQQMVTRQPGAWGGLPRVEKEAELRLEMRMQVATTAAGLAEYHGLLRQDIFRWVGGRP